MRAKGGKVGFANKVQAPMPPAASKSDASRVQQGMDGKDKNRAVGGSVAGKGAAGRFKLKSPGAQSGKIGLVEKGSSSKGKDDGKVKDSHQDGTTNQSGKKFKDGGATGKDEKSDEEESQAAADEEEDDDADEAAAKEVAKGASAKAYGVRTEERKHGGKVKRADGGATGADMARYGRISASNTYEDDPSGPKKLPYVGNDAPVARSQAYSDPRADALILQGGDFGPDGPPPGLRAKGGKVGFHPGGEKGKLHRELGISTDKKIPAKRLAKAEHSKNPEIKDDAIRAETMKKWKH